VSCVLYTKAGARLPLRRLSRCYLGHTKNPHDDDDDDDDDLRRSSTNDNGGTTTLNDNQGPSLRRDARRDPTAPPYLVTKLLEQNARLKNFARQLIAERGLTVTQYLVCLPPYSCRHIYICRRGFGHV